MNPPLLQVCDLVTEFDVEGGGRATAVAGVSFEVHSGEVLGVVGESGSGKSVTALSVVRLVPDPPGRIRSGRILFRGVDLLGLPLEEVRAIRGRDIGMVFQEPMTSLNPVFPIGMQVAEAVRVNEGASRAEARERAVRILTEVGIPDAARRLDDYPHQFSGGMRQRVMIATALIRNPALLIADEPTTALDVTIQAQILDLMLDLQARRPESAILLITHDLAVVAGMCHRVIVMYAGRVQEVAHTRALFDAPLHPYTRGLLRSSPHAAVKGRRMEAIPGNVPAITNLPAGCRFHNRCALVVDRCRAEEPALRELRPGHWVRCHRAEES